MNPYDKLRLLQERITAEVSALDMAPISVVFMAAEDGSDLVQIVFKIEPTALKSTEERKTDQVNNVFDDLVENMQVMDELASEPELSEDDQILQDKMDEAKRKLEGWSDNDNDGPPS